jgi:hypothetical protein
LHFSKFKPYTIIDLTILKVLAINLDLPQKFTIRNSESNPEPAYSLHLYNSNKNTGDQEGLSELAIHLRTFFYSATLQSDMFCWFI